MKKKELHPQVRFYIPFFSPGVFKFLLYNISWFIYFIKVRYSQHIELEIKLQKMDSGYFSKWNQQVIGSTFLKSYKCFIKNVN